MEKGITVEKISFYKTEHQEAFILLLTEYMMDLMGGHKPLKRDKALKVINDLSRHYNYKGFLLKLDGQYVAMSNCFVNYSTFKAQHLLNVHDFIVSPNYRRRGLGKALLEYLIDYSTKNDFCRLNLEVREDNVKAQGLYKKVGFKPCTPSMLFWEYELNT